MVLAVIAAVLTLVVLAFTGVIDLRKIGTRQPCPPDYQSGQYQQFGR